MGGSNLIPKPAQYLLRFDDLCPTMDFGRWDRFLPLIEEFGIRPILAIVPDNKDRDLERAVPDPEFWGRMRAMEAAGASIALHGFQHLCNNQGKSMVPSHPHSEFAGVSAGIQRQWISSGLKILRGHGLNPCLWVAPRHGFDWQTLEALRAEGIGLVSDGFARVPFTRAGLTWIPQQLWSPVKKAKGLWTICLHTNTACDSQVDQLRVFLGRHASQFTSVDRVVAEWEPGKLSFVEGIHETAAVWRIQVSRVLKGVSRKGAI
jgi:predicted deacetylase